MGSLEDKARAAGEGAKGNVEKAAGKLTGDEEMQARGEADKLKGSADKTLGEAKDTGHDLKRKVQDATR